MARTLRILDEDPESRPKVKSSDFAGRFRAGMQLNNRPVSLEHWRITAGDPEVAKAVHELFGGSAPEEWETTKEDALQVLTERDAVKVVVDSADDVTFRMALYGMQGPIHVCDGVEFTDPEDAQYGKPCGCPSTVQERKALAKAGRGPKPDCRITFRLADDPALGKFRLMTGSWDFTKSLERVWADLDEVGGPALCTLRLELVKFTTKSGVNVEYRKPVLQVHGKVPEDIDAAMPSLAKVAAEEDEVPF